MAPYLLEVVFDVFFMSPRGLSPRRGLLVLLVTGLFVAGTLLVVTDSLALLTVGVVLLLVAALVVGYTRLAAGR